MKEKLFLLCLALFILLPLAAQNSAGSFSIKGQVVDSLSNESVPFATLRIVLATAPGQPVKLLACDENGKFETPLTVAGEYIIQLQSIGKLPAEKSFTLSAGNSKLDLGILRMADNTQQLGEVSVVAQKPLVKVEVDKITYSLTDDPEAQVSTTLDILRKVPLVTVDGNEEIQLKGSTNFKIYMNGKPSNLLSNNPKDVLKSMPASSVKDIEVITDPGSKYDAEGVGGIINIITNQNALQGYTGTVRTYASTLGSMGGSAYLSSKIGKLGLTAMYNYSYQNSPWNTSEIYRENLINAAEKYMTQNGRNKYSGPYQYGYLEASYEIDTLNLINVGANLFGAKMKNQSELYVEMLDSLMNHVYNYNRNSNTTSNYGSIDANVDYQHSTRKKGELLTVSYRFSNSPDGSDTYTDIYDVVNYRSLQPYPEKTNNDAWTAEHTGQVDYTTPIFGNQTLEVGVKYIFRQSNSETDRTAYIDSLDTWKDISKSDSYFKHTQHIYSGYLGYGLKLAKWGLKAGVRGEGTALDVKFKRAPEQNFSTNYFDLVPNATISYQINMSNQLRLGYNMRIYRPGIWYLNPYVNNTDPQNIFYGNPDLESEKSNSVNLNYSLFTQKFNLNGSLTYTFVNNSIERYTFIDPALPNIAQTTYDNIGKRQTVGGFVYGSWTPVPLFRLTLNGGLNYTDMESAEYGMGNSGWNGRLFATTQFTFPKDFRVNWNGGYYSPFIMLQGERSGMYFTGISLSKEFFNKKLTVMLSANEPFRKSMKYETTSADRAFNMQTTNYQTVRSLYLNVSYRFGTLKEQIKKVQRGISNDDVKAGGSGSGGGEGTTM